jgi:hypothetical protein
MSLVESTTRPIGGAAAGGSYGEGGGFEDGATWGHAARLMMLG